MSATNFSWKPFPAITAILMLVNAGVYVAQHIAGLPWSPTPEQQIAWGGNAAVLTLTGDYWRLASNLFLHFGVPHLLFNMAFLSSVGPRAEREFGRSYFLAIYLIGGMLASFASAWWLGRHATGADLLGRAVIRTVVSAGASGAIMAVCGALLSSFALTEVFGKTSIHEPGFGKDLAIVVGINAGLGMVVTGTDQVAHLGGLFAGALLALCFASLQGTGSAGRRFGLAAVPLLFGAVLCWAMVASAPLAGLQQRRAAFDEEAAERRAMADQSNAEAARKLLAEQEEKQLPAPVSAEVASGKSIEFGKSGSSFALSADEKTAYAVDHEANQLAVIDLVSSVVEKRIQGPALKKGQDAVNDCHSYACDNKDTLEVVVLKDKTFALVTAMQPDAVTFIDLSAGRVEKHVVVGKDPRAIVLAPDEQRAYVQTGHDNTISVIDVATRKAIGKLRLTSDEARSKSGRRMSMWFSADGRRLYASNAHGWHVVGFDLNSLEELPGTAEGFEAHLESVVPVPGASDSVLAVNRGVLQLLDIAGKKASKRWEFCGEDETPSYDFNHALAARAGGGHLIAVGHDGMPDWSEIQVAHLETGAAVGRFPAGHFIRKMQFSADGRRLFTVSSQGVFSILDLRQRLADKPDRALLCDFPVVSK